MAELTVEMTYASALVEAAKDLGITKTVLEEAEELVSLIDREDDLKKFIFTPAISALEKKKTLQNIFEGRICKELLNFLYVLVDKRRIGNLEGIVKCYKSIIEKEEGYTYGTVYSVIKLSDNRIAELEDEVSKLMNMNVKLENEIDKKLLAGVKIMVDGKVIDASYRAKLNDLASQLHIS